MSDLLFFIRDWIGLQHKRKENISLDYIFFLMKWESEIKREIEFGEKREDDSYLNLESLFIKL
jgi:hypothetical protein